MMRTRIAWFRTLAIAVAFTLVAGIPAFAQSYQSFEGSHSSQWQLVARDGLLIGGYGDNFVYDGNAVKPVGGVGIVDVNTRTNRGRMTATFYGTIEPEQGKSYTGEVRLVYDEFSGGPPFMEGGIADFVYLHGGTGQEAPVMPRLRSYLASWGDVDIYVDGEKIYEDLVGHTMLTEGARDRRTYAIYDSSGDDFYSPRNPGDSSIANPNTRAMHFVAHTTESDPDNFPPHTVWLHLNFQTVEEY
jgi:hypothetical protein